MNGKFKLTPFSNEYVKYTMLRGLKCLQQCNANGRSFGHIPPPNEIPPYKMETKPLDTLPAYYNLVDEGKVTSVKDQGQCGACWAFATYGSLESRLLPGEAHDFSENNLINNHGFDSSPCGGGNPQMSTAYLSRWDGPVNEADDPYPYVQKISPESIAPSKHIQEVIYCNTSPKDIDSIKSIVYNLGAAYCSIYWDQYDAYYNKLTYAYYCPQQADTNHGVTIVGWDDNYKKENFAPYIPPANGAYIIKNSWGMGFGDKGYNYISYYDSNFVARAVFNNAEPTNNYSSIYQYDYLGCTQWSNISSNTIYMCNVFKAPSDDTISALGFYTDVPNTEYSIAVYILEESQSIPRHITIKDTDRGNIGTLLYPGYHTVTLDTPLSVPAGSYFVCQVGLTNNNSYPSIALEQNIAEYSSGAKIGPGESYLWDGQEWIDLYSEGFGNLCIKAFGESAVSAAKVEFYPESMNVSKSGGSQYSSEFEVNVNISDLTAGQKILGFHDKVTFDPAFLEVVKIDVPGDCFLNPILFKDTPFDNAAGTIDFNLARSDTAYPGSSGTVYKITLKAKKNGTTNLNHAVVDLRDENNNNIAVTVNECTINIVSMIGDFNGDSKIDFDDLMLFAASFGKKSGDPGWDSAVAGIAGSPFKEKDIGPLDRTNPGTPPNLNIKPDGKIDFEDLTVFAQMWIWYHNPKT